jgi:hypothetical protein
MPFSPAPGYELTFEPTSDPNETSVIRCIVHEKKMMKMMKIMMKIIMMMMMMMMMSMRIENLHYFV